MMVSKISAPVTGVMSPYLVEMYTHIQNETKRQSKCIHTFKMTQKDSQNVYTNLK